MNFVRYSAMTPRAGQAARVRELVDQLLEFQRTRDGFITGYRLDPEEGGESSVIGRLTVWESEADANATAMEAHDLTLRAELMQAIDQNTHEERAFNAEAFESS